MTKECYPLNELRKNPTMGSEIPEAIVERSSSAEQGQQRSLRTYHPPILFVHGCLRDLTQGTASGNGDGSSFGKKPHGGAGFH